jgi:hypothetical protein
VLAVRARARLRSAVLGAGQPLRSQLDAIQLQLGAIESRRVAALPPTDVREAEFKVFSQFGEDGIIQYLIHKVPIENDTFVEFGVESYAESNTRFLLSHDNWRGLIIDSGTAHREVLERTGLLWRHHIDARTAFIDRDNINSLIGDAGIRGDIGLLSIDIDGNDYWVLEALDVVSPRILVVEYNSTFGPEAAVTIPYDADFRRDRAHYSHLYWGASLSAFAELAARKSYALVGGNSAGNNAFFVRSDVFGSLREVPVAEAYAAARFRESRTSEGRFSLIGDHEEKLRLIKDMPLWNVSRGCSTTVAQACRLGCHS